MVVRSVVKWTGVVAGIALVVCGAVTGARSALAGSPEKLDDAVRAQQIKNLRWGMFVCWSFSTFSGHEWTPTRDKDASFFRATGCDTDQWCRTAKEAEMGYILFLTKHHDGFCLWDTATTEKKVTNSPLGIDVLARLRKSCDRYGLKLALYFSEGDWNWPGAVDGKGGKGGYNPEVKKAQLKELCTKYGPIEFFWMDHAVGDGGLSHRDTVRWIHQFQPNCFVGFNHGEPAGRLAIRERGRPGPLGEASLRRYGKNMETAHKFLVAEFTYPILPPHKGGAQWFYSLPKYDNLCLPAEKIYRDYLGAVKYGNIFSLDVGPNYAGRLREIDVRTLRKVGRYIRGELPPPPTPLSLHKKATASSVWKNDVLHYGPQQVVDGDSTTRWGAAPGARSGWLEIDLGRPQAVSRAVVDEAGWDRVRQYEIQAWVNGGWQTVAAGKTLGPNKQIRFKQPVTAQRFRLNILKAVDVPTIVEFELWK